MISRRISNITCDKEYFDIAVPDYDNALKNSAFNENIKFTSRPPKRRKRGRNILWFNSSFSSNVTTNIGKIFLQLLDKHFPKLDHKYYNITSCLIGITLKQAIVVCRTWHALFKTTTLIY